MKEINLNYSETALSKAIRYVYDPIGQFIKSEEFKELARKNPEHFTRDRGLPLPDLVLMILNYRKGTINSELEQFTQAIYGQDTLPKVTPSAFCQARQKLRPEALIGLNSRILDEFEARFALHRWHGFRILAVDGSTGQLPNEEVIAEIYGGPTDANAPRARFCRLYDVLNKVIICSDMEPYEVGEREIAAPYLYEVKENDLLLYDRGFPAFWFFAMHRDMGRSFCARAKLSHSSEVREFVASGERTRIVTLSPPSAAKAQCEDYNLDILHFSVDTL